MKIALVLADLALVMGATLRLIRLIAVDDLGLWLVRRPAYRWASTMEERESPGWPLAKPDPPVYDRVPYDPQYEGVTFRQKVVSGLDCPFCAGFWIGLVMLGSLVLMGGPGHAFSSWRFVAGALTLNYIAAHISSRLEGSPDGSTE